MISLLADLDRFARDIPDSTALSSPAHEWTFGELKRTVAGTAERLRANGVEPSQLVAIDLPAAHEWIVDLALLHIAARSVSVRGAAAGDLAPDVIVSGGTRGGMLAPLMLTVDDEWLREAGAGASIASIVEFARPDSIWRMMLTSGTTGRPRAAAYSLSALEHRRAGLNRYWTNERPELNFMGLSTTGGLHTAVAALAHGEAFRAVDRIDEESLRFAAAQRIEVLCGSPVQVGVAIDVMVRHGIRLPDLAEVRLAGATPSTALLELVDSRLGVPTRSVYGSTEGGGVTARMLRPGDDTSDVGVPLPGLDVQIGPGGRVRYRIQGMVSGYFEGGTVTPFPGGWFEPGDIGSIRDDGALVLDGRESELVNVAGTKVDPTRVDAVALEMHGVTDAAAFGVERRPGIPELALALVCTPECDLRALDRMMRHTFPVGHPTLYWRVPAIPRNRMGKVERSALAPLFLEQNPV